MGTGVSLTLLPDIGLLSYLVASWFFLLICCLLEACSKEEWSRGEGRQRRSRRSGGRGNCGWDGLCERRI